MTAPVNAAQSASRFVYHENTNDNLYQITQAQIEFEAYAAPVPQGAMGQWGLSREYSSNGVRWFLLHEGEEALSVPTGAKTCAYVSNVFKEMYNQMYEEIYGHLPPDAAQEEAPVDPLMASPLSYDQLVERNTRLSHKILLRNKQIEEQSAAINSLKKALVLEEREHERTRRKLMAQRKANAQRAS